MIRTLKDTNLLDWFEKQTVPVAITHQANCFHTMGGGIARQIAMRYPEAEAADFATPHGDHSKLGTFSYALVERLPHHVVYNLYSQFTFGMGKQTLYDPMVEGLEKLRTHAISKDVARIGLPFNMGCTLGGGDWRIVSTIIDTIFKDDKEVELYICQYEPKR